VQLSEAEVLCLVFPIAHVAYTLHAVALPVQLSEAEVLCLVFPIAHVAYTLHAVALPVQLSEAEVRGIMLQLLTAVQYLHRNGVWHRDIKSANILMTYTNGVRCARTQSSYLLLFAAERSTVQVVL
jgi:serine/threonine protein kinase